MPVKHEFGQSIHETKIADPKAVEKHWKSIVANYARTPGFKRWRDELQSLFESATDSLAEVSIAATEWMLSKLNARARRIRASGVEGAEGQASALVASICKTLGATEYLTGTGALAYMNTEDFQNIGCEILVQQWKPFEYQQAHAGFAPDLSTLDLLLNCPDTAAQVIEAAGDWKPL